MSISVRYFHLEPYGIVWSELYSEPWMAPLDSFNLFCSSFLLLSFELLLNVIPCNRKRLNQISHRSMGRESNFIFYFSNLPQMSWSFNPCTRTAGARFITCVVLFRPGGFSCRFAAVRRVGEIIRKNITSEFYVSFKSYYSTKWIR